MNSFNDFIDAGGDKRIVFTVLKGERVEDVLYHAVYDTAHGKVKDPKGYCGHILIVKTLLEDWYKTHDPLPRL